MPSAALRYPKSLWSYNPIPGGCVLYTPLWSPSLHGPVFKSADPFGHICTRTGGVMSGDGFTGDGDDDIEITNVLTRLLATTTMGTWLAQVKIDDVTPATDESFVSFGDTDANRHISLLLTLTSGLLTAIGGIPSGVKWLVDTDSAPFSAATWYQVGLVQDGTSPVLYVDGVAPSQAFLVTTDKTWWFADDANLDNGYIAAANINSDGKSSQLNGSVGESLIYDRALSSAEILYIYNQTRGRFE